MESTIQMVMQVIVPLGVLAFGVLARGTHRPDDYDEMSGYAFSIGAVVAAHALMYLAWGAVPALLAVVFLCVMLVDVPGYVRHYARRRTPAGEPVEQAPSVEARQPAGTATGLTAAEQDAWDDLSNRLAE